MKIRNGFVSNSSSSSFIIVLDKKPESAQEVLSVLDLPEYVSPYQDQCLPANKIADYVFEDIKDYKYNEEELQKLFAEIIYDYAPARYHRVDGKEVWKLIPEEAKELWEKYKDVRKKEDAASESYKFQGEKRDKMEKEYDSFANEADEIQQKLGALAFKKFQENVKDKFVFCVEYEDHTTAGTVMEHGEIFRNVTHFRISYH